MIQFLIKFDKNPYENISTLPFFPICELPQRKSLKMRYLSETICSQVCVINFVVIAYYYLKCLTALFCYFCM